MHEDIVTAVDALMPGLIEDLASLVRIPSVSAPGYDTDEVRRSAHAVAELLQDAGCHGARLLEIEGAHPAVYAELPAEDGAPTVLLYAHHDVQPPGPSEEWRGDPFEPLIENGRMYGRGAADDKGGLTVHLGAIRALGASRRVGIKLFIEGEEEVGSSHLAAFLDAYGDLLEADVVVIADSGNVSLGTPSFTTSLRGLVDCHVEVRTLGDAVHSGVYGGAVPDALMAMSRLLAGLHDDSGEVAIAGLRTAELSDHDLEAGAVLAEAGAVDGLELIGSGSLSSRMWGKPAVSILALDAPRVDEAINQIVPVAKAVVSMRIPPGQPSGEAMQALVDHLQANAPWGARVTVTPGRRGEAFHLGTSGPAYEAFRTAFEMAYGETAANVGIGGSIPFVAAYSAMFPEATILITGVGDPASRWHGPDESQDLAELRRGIIGEALALHLLAAG